MSPDATPARSTARDAPLELRIAPNGAVTVAVPAWQHEDAWLWHGFSTRRGGVSRAYLDHPAGDHPQGELNLGFTASDEADNVRENRRRFVEAVTRSRATPLITVRQIHSNRSVVADAAVVELSCAALPGTTQALEADGLITAETGVVIGIQTADCIPVLVADRRERVVAAFHAGWRGTARRIVELGVARMREEFGSDPADLIAAIGPGIGSCCYTVGDEVWNEFGAQFVYSADLFLQRTAGGAAELRLDLIGANRRQLTDAGLKAEAVSVVSGCTACQPEWFYSHRASHGHAGRLMAVIGIR